MKSYWLVVISFLVIGGFLQSPDLLAESHQDNKAQTIALSAEELSWIADHPVITVGASKDWAPMDFTDDEGRHAGISADYLRLIEERSGLAFKPVTDLNWNDALEKTKAHKLDGMISISYTAKRDRYLNFSDPYFAIGKVIIVRKETNDVNGIDDLKGRTVAVEEGYLIQDQLAQDYPDIVTIGKATTLDALLAVIKKEADAYLGNMAVVNRLMETHQLVTLKVSGMGPYEPAKLRIALRQDWSDTPLQIVNKALAAVTEEEHREILERWVSISSDISSYQIRKDVTFSDKEKEWIKDNPVISIGAVKDCPPFDFTDEKGIHSGISADYLNLLKRLTGLRFEVVTDLSWNQVIQKARRRELDGVATVYRTAERENYLYFSEAYFMCPEAIVINKDVADIRNINDLSNKTVVVEKGYFLENQLRSAYPSIKILNVADTLAALLAVSNREAHAYIGNTAVVFYIMEKHQLTNLKIGGLSPFKPMRIRIALRNDWPPEAIGIINKGLAAIDPETKRKIQRKWIGINFEDFVSDEQIVELSEREEAWLAAHKNIRLGVDPSWPPFEFVDQTKTYKGISSDYVNILSEKLKVEMTPAPGLSWQQVIDGAKEGRIDVLPCVAETPERSRFLNFTKPYIIQPMVIMTRNDAPFVGDIDEILGENIAVINDHITHEYLRRDYPDIDLYLVSDIEEAVEAVAEKKAYALVDNLAAIEFAVRRLGVTNLKVSGHTKYNFELSMGVRKDWPELVEIFDKQLAAVPRQRKSNINSSWINVHVERRTDWAQVKKHAQQFALIAAVIVLMFLFWNRRLDRTVRRRTAELRASEEQYRLLFDSGNDALFVHALSEDGRPGPFIQVNEVACKRLGYDRDELAELRPADIEPAEFDEAGAAVFRELMIDKQAVFETVHKTKDGRKIPVEISSRLFQMHGDNFVLSIARNITERKKAEEELIKHRDHLEDLVAERTTTIAESEARFRGYYENSSDPHLIYSDEGILDCNDAMVRLLGCKDKKELLRRRPAEFSPEYQPDRKASGEKSAEMDAIAYRRGFYRFDWIFTRTDDEPLPVEVTLTPVTQGGGKPVLLAVWHDLTERKKAEKKLRQNMEDLERFNRLAAGREEKMIQLKTKINKLLVQCGEPEKYKIVK